MMIESQGFKTQFSNGKILSFPDLRLSEPGVMLMQGPNGSGKSCYLECLAGLRPFHEGRLQIFDQDVKPQAKRPKSWKDRLLMIAQQPPVFQGSVLEVASFPLLFRGMKNDALIQKRLQQFGLIDCADQKSRQLSRGQKMRLALVQALLLSPDLLLLDEPFAHLDQDFQFQLIELLKEEGYGQRKALIFSSHQALDLGDWVSARCDLE